MNDLDSRPFVCVQKEVYSYRDDMLRVSTDTKSYSREKNELEALCANVPIRFEKAGKFQVGVLLLYSFQPFSVYLATPAEPLSRCRNE